MRMCDRHLGASTPWHRCLMPRFATTNLPASHSRYWPTRSALSSGGRAWWRVYNRVP